MKKHFTLIELLVVIAIIGILASILLPSLSKARKKTQIAVCLSQQKQIHNATHLFLSDNNYRFPFAKFSGSDTNTGRFWLGKIGKSGDYKVNVQDRPLNKYLGYTQNNTEVPVAKCPLSKPGQTYDNSGSCYMAAARQEHTDDLDRQNEAIFLSEVYKPTKMVLVGEVGGWHYSAWEDNPWKSGSQWHEIGQPVYSFSFVDGHVKNIKIRGGLGINNDSDILNFRNFE